MHERENARHHWLKSVLNTTHYRITPLHGDASFRRYYRLYYGNNQAVLMDAPPMQENLRAFINMAQRLREHGLRTPTILAAEEQMGFALLEDLGDTLLLQRLSPEQVDFWYGLALDKLVKLQQCPHAALAVFDEAYMLYELEIFVEWFLQGYLKLSLSAKEQALIRHGFTWLTQEVAQQPQVMIHRDFHSRNLMVINESNNPDLALIDFQDAMLGPISYDLVSLLKDCYIQWPSERLNGWVTLFHQRSVLAQQHSLTAFSRAFELCGLQRHLKVLGVFSRLHLRDNKPNYLQDLPLTLHYVLACLEMYPELSEFYQFMQHRIRLP